MNKKSTKDIKRYNFKVDDWDVNIEYSDDIKIEDEIISEAKDKAKDISSIAMKKMLPYVKKEYNSYVDEYKTFNKEHDIDTIPLSKVLSSVSNKAIIFTYSEKSGKLDKYVDVWVSYKSWADDKESDLCPMVSCVVNTEDLSVEYMTLHLG